MSSSLPGGRLVKGLVPARKEERRRGRSEGEGRVNGPRPAPDSACRPVTADLVNPRAPPAATFRLATTAAVGKPTRTQPPPRRRLRPFSAEGPFRVALISPPRHVPTVLPGLPSGAAAAPRVTPDWARTRMPFN